MITNFMDSFTTHSSDVMTRRSFSFGMLAAVSSLSYWASAANAAPVKPRRYADTNWWDPYVENITDTATYLRRKFRQDVTDKSTGLSADNIFEELTAIVAKGAANGEAWRVTKSKCFAFQVERQSIDVSHLDWFPAIAIWNRLDMPIRKIRGKRAEEVNARMLAPALIKEWQDGNASGDWMMWQDFDHSVPDWRVIAALGFPGMKARLMRYAKSGDPFYDGLALAMDAMLRGIDRFIG
jgi:hypothetical protein